MEVVGSVGRNICSQTGGEKPGNLGTSGQGLRSAASDGVLAIRCAVQLVVAVTAHEMPLGAEVVVQASDAEVAGLRNGHVARKSADIAAGGRIVAEREAVAAGSIRQGHRGPHLLYERIDSDAARIQSRSRIGHAVEGHGGW